MEIRPIFSTLLRNKTSAVLLTAQIALTLAIICNALYVVNERLAVATRDSGVTEHEVFRLSVLSYAADGDIADTQRSDILALKNIPGVIAAAWTNQTPLSQSGWSLGLSNDPSADSGQVNAAAYFGPDSLVDALGLSMIEGQDFQPEHIREVDPAKAQLSADHVIISRELGLRLFPNRDSYIGQTAYLGSGDSAQPMQVVGVVDRLMSPWGQSSDDAFTSFIVPVRYLSDNGQYVLRVDAGQRSRIMADAEAALLAASDGRLVLQNETMEELRATRYRNHHAVAGMLIAVTAGLLLVTASGIVGMASLWVTQRRKQIGTRRALGATRLDILRYFITENLLIGIAGVVLGIALAIALNLFLVRQIALPTLPPIYLAGAAATLLLLGVLAVLGPAWRAASVSPAVATRSV